MSNAHLTSSRLKARRRRRRANVTLIFALACLVFVLSLSYLLRLKILNIQSVSVSGTRVLNQSEIKKIVINDLSGSYFYLIPKTSILFYSKNKIQNELLKRFVPLKSLNIRVAGGTLAIKISEREPYALWCKTQTTLAQSCFVADHSGFIFNPANTDQGVLFTGDSFKEGQNPVGQFILPQEQFEKLITFLDTLSALGFSLDSIQKHDTSLSLIFTNHSSLIVNSDQDFNIALENLQVFLQNQTEVSKKDGGFNVEYLDLRFGNKIFFKPKDVPAKDSSLGQ